MENNRRSFLKRLVQGTFVMGGAGVFTLRKDALLIPVVGQGEGIPNYAQEDRFLRNATQEDIMNLCCNILDAMDGKSSNETVTNIIGRYFQLRGQGFDVTHTVVADMKIEEQKEIEKHEGFEGIQHKS